MQWLSKWQPFSKFHCWGCNALWKERGDKQVFDENFEYYDLKIAPFLVLVENRILR